MCGLIIAFAGKNNCVKIREILEGCGCAVNAVCRSGAEAIRNANRFDAGVIVCGYKLADMTVEDFCCDLPENFMLLVLTKHEELIYCIHDNVFKLQSPATAHELTAAVNMLMEVSGRSLRAASARSREEKTVIDNAKAFLIDSFGMAEEQAHRFIQKKSMDLGIKMTELSRLILGEDL